ncbi:protein NRT1/ PTR FAMILY 5.2-like [Cannabis sativa]|uniref:protein NRT1/ PTR FAMILY 5.2-like n=1 Tax=Cannabis sativa TaxID=3483 RepID=UPI0029CA1E07|nr:protein NRT1/ PTR FAMILY 5.2-like [Cannabis sativa]
MARKVDDDEKGQSDENYTEDGTVDLKGRPVLRSNTGKWTACSFIVGYEVFERMAYYGISTNLVLYLTNKLHEGTVTSSNNVTNWAGTVWMTPILGAYIADAYLGRYTTFLIASAIYLLGMLLLTLTVSVPGLKPPSCGHGIKVEDCKKRASNFQVGIFYCALYIIAIGTGGTKPNISTMGADQFDEYEPKEKMQKLSFFNWWMFSIFFGTLFSNTFLVYIQDNVGWAIGYGLPTIGLAFAILVFLVGTKFYRHKWPSGSPLTKIVMVIVAAIGKWKVTLPTDPKELYELSLEDYAKSGKFRIDHTPSLRFLDKAAVKTSTNSLSSPWRLTPVTQVEETKQILKMIPILVATFIPSIMIAQGHTLFIKQGTTLNRSMGPNFEIPPACLAAFITIFMLISIVLYDRCFVPIVRRYTQNPRGITLLQRLGIGLILHTIIMVTACLAERKRLSVARENEINDKHQIVPLTIFILLPQFALMGVADSFVETAKLEFFYDQAPLSMKSLGTSYFTSSLGIGNFLSSFVLTTVSDYTKRGGRKGWILDNLNVSHLDYYYAFLAVLSFLNFFFFLFVAKSFVYNVDVTELKKDLAMEISSKDKTLVLESEATHTGLII